MKKRIKNILKLYKDLYNLDGFYVENLNNVKSQTDKLQHLSQLEIKVKNCKNCPLHTTRVKTVFGEGNSEAQIMFVGEGPGFEEDKQGRPFVGRAGELLTKIIKAMGLERENVYITNIVKCHPLVKPDPELRNNDRPPTKEEIEACYNYLREQIEIINPKVICCLGSTAAKVLTSNDVPISELRGKIFEYKYNNVFAQIVPTYHPAALLRNPSLKPSVWKDIQIVMKISGLPLLK
ncbi:MAG: uracil-DNA glycosylase [Endomicrobia bacterium]|nr:uracil-DNA glycosylase [Endomicrobiia bacterium]